MPGPLITIEPVEPDLGPDRIDERLAAGFFPFGQRWMTCHAWPRLEETRDTIWLRVRLSRSGAAASPPTSTSPSKDPPRWRKLRREGATISVGNPLPDDEHQRLYDRFRELRHPDWVEAVGGLIVSNGDVSPLLDHTRELAIRDDKGRLLAFRWFLQGRAAIAGITAIYDPSNKGHGTLARTLTDEWAAEQGFAWSYPGYVFPGSAQSWDYKIKRGRSEWLDPDTGSWRPWDSDPPQPETLVIREMRRRLATLGRPTHYPGWAIPFLSPAPLALAWPYYVVRLARPEAMTLVVWNHVSRRFEELHAAARRDPDDDEPVPPPPGAGE